MRNFDKKVQHLNRLFMYKFSVYDKKNQKLKIYYISPDKSHIYLMVDNIIGVNGYLCEIGQLYITDATG